MIVSSYMFEVIALLCYVGLRFVVSRVLRSSPCHVSCDCHIRHSAGAVISKDAHTHARVVLCDVKWWLSWVVLWRFLYYVS